MSTMEDQSQPPQTPDKAAILKHFKVQTRRWHELGQDVRLECRLLAEGYNPLNLTYDLGSLEQAAEDVEHWTAKGRNAYAVVNPIKPNTPPGATDKDVAAAFFAFADCDEPEAAEALRNFVGPKWTHVVATGTVPHVRVHPYWELTEPITDLDRWTELQKRIAARLGSDRVVVNPSRIMRIAGTITWPNDRKRDRGYVSELCTIRTEYDDGRGPVPFEQLERAFPAEAQQAPAGGVTTLAGIDTGPQPLDRQRAVIAASDGQEWHNNIIRLVASYVSKGLSDNEIHALTDPLTLAGYTVEDTRREVQTAINGARAKGWTPEIRKAFDHAPQPSTGEDQLPPVNQGAGLANPTPETPVTWKIQTTFDFLADFVAPEYVLEGVIQRGRLYTLTAPTGHGKTAAMLHVASHIAAGREICSRETEQGSVLFLAGENPDDVRARVIGSLEAYGFDSANLDLHFIAGTFSIRQDFANLQAAASSLPNLVAIVVDTFAAYFDGDNENDNAQALDFARVVRGLTILPSKPCVIMPAHPVKNATKSNLTPKGGSSLLNEVDGNLTIWNDDGLLTMHWQGKHRGPDFDPLTMELKSHESSRLIDKHGRLMPTIVAHSVGTMRAIELAGNTVSVETKILTSIDRHPALPVRERAVDCGVSRSSMGRALERFVKRKWARKKGRKIVLTDQGFEALEDGKKGVSNEISED